MLTPSLFLASWLWPSTPSPEPVEAVPEPPPTASIFFCEEQIPVDATELLCTEGRDFFPPESAKPVDLTPLSALTALKTLDFFAGDLEFIDTMVVSDVSPLASLPALRSLTLNHTTLRDIRPLGQMDALTSLSLHASRVSDISPVSSMKALESLDLSCSPVNDLRPLVGLDNLEQLDITMAPVADLSPLLELPGLQRLGIRSEQHNDPVILKLQQLRPDVLVYEGPRY